MYDYLLSATEAFIRYGLSPTALIVAIIALFKTKHAKRLIARRLPWLFRDESDVLQYQERQKRIESKIDALLAERGIEWNLPPPISKQAKTQHIRNYFSYSRKGIQWVNQLRRVKKMKNKFKSRKFWMAVVTAVLVVLNDGLNLGIDQETVLAFAGIVATFIIGESAVDAKRAASNNVTKEEESYH